MLRPGYPQFTYSPEEGARVAFAPELGPELDAQTSDLLQVGEQVAVCTNLSRENAPDVVLDLSIALSKAIKPEGQVPFLQVRPGAYGGFLYRVSADFRGSLDELMSDESRAETVARDCFAAMGRMDRGNHGGEDNFRAFNFVAGNHIFDSGVMNLSINDGSIGNLYFGGDAGLHTIPGDMSVNGDVVRHYNTDYEHQSLGLLLGIGSLAHSAYRHSLISDLAGVLASDTIAQAG